MFIEFKAIIFVHCGVNGTVQNITQWWIHSGMHIGALGVHPTFYPAVQKLKAALYLLNQYVYYNSLNISIQNCNQDTCRCKFDSMLLHRARFTYVVHPAPHENHLAEFTTGYFCRTSHIVFF